ncbi:MAG: glycosyltransferase family A protein [Thermodesulfobacteriota bacterium]
MTLISVIIPTYNRVDFLPGAVASVLSQQARVELIVVDDGSTDGTADFLATLPSAVRCLRQENRGPAAARNTGIRAARGDYLAFLDSDDRFQADKLTIQYAAMVVNPSFPLSHTGEVWYRRGRLLHQKKKHRKEQGDLFPRCLELCAIGMSTVMARRALFEEVGLFDEGMACCEDYDFWLRVCCRYPVLLVDLPLTVKNGGRDDQVSVIHRVGMDRYRIESISRLLAAGALSREQQQLAVTELARKCRIYAAGCRKHGREEEAARVLRLLHAAFTACR